MEVVGSALPPSDRSAEIEQVYEMARENLGAWVEVGGWRKYSKAANKTPAFRRRGLECRLRTVSGKTYLYVRLDPDTEIAR